MGRLRTTGCTKRHWPNETCALCARIRARKSRERRRAQHKNAVKQAQKLAREARKRGLQPPEPAPPQFIRTPERIALDDAAKARRETFARARAYVAKYRERGALIIPTRCEHCGMVSTLGTRKPATLHAWHPDPTKPRQVAWLCTSCRNRARCSDDLIVLRWQWPGTPMLFTPGRPPQVAIDPRWFAAAQAAAQNTNLAQLATDLFFTVFTKVAGTTGEQLFRQAMRATARQQTWVPTGNPAQDERLREWAAYEHAVRQSSALTRTERLVEPLVHWERRERIDRLPLLPPPAMPAASRKPFDQEAYERNVAIALEKITTAESVVDELIRRLKAFK